MRTPHPQTDPLFLAVLAIHVLAALPCVASGAVAALSAKGSARHIRTGRVYYWSLGLVFATATAIAAMRWTEDYHLFIIGSIAFTAGSVGYLHRRLRRPGDATHITGMGTSYIALLTAFYVNNGKNLPLWSPWGAQTQSPTECMGFAGRSNKCTPRAGDR